MQKIQKMQKKMQKMQRMQRMQKMQKTLVCQAKNVEKYGNARTVMFFIAFLHFSPEKQTFSVFSAFWEHPTSCCD